MLKKLTIWCFFLFFMSCCKDDSPVPEVFPPRIYTGTATAFKNNKPWNASTYFKEYSTFPGTFILGADVYNQEGFWRECFGILKVKNVLELQTITSTESSMEPDELFSDYGTITSDGDVIGDIYDLDTTATNNYIQITNYNSERAEIEGIFNVSLVLNRDDGRGETPPDKLKFTNGKFTAEVKREWFE